MDPTLILRNVARLPSASPALARSAPTACCGAHHTVPFALPAADNRTEEEIARAVERRREQGKKLQEMAAKVRIEKVRSPDIFLLFNHL